MDNLELKTLCSHNKKRHYLFLCTGILAFHIIALFFICDRSLAQEQTFKAPVVVSRIVEMDVRQPVKMVGTVFPLRESIVACSIEGLVVEFPVKRGDYVKKGQVLAELDTTSLEIRLKGAKADKHLALIQYERAKELYCTSNNALPERKDSSHHFNRLTHIHFNDARHNYRRFDHLSLCQAPVTYKGQSNCVKDQDPGAQK